jgi:hypothetical protein
MEEKKEREKQTKIERERCENMEGVRKVDDYEDERKKEYKQKPTRKGTPEM